jgi:voltage-gated potassium channel
MNETFRRKRMEKAVREMKSHYIVCGLAGAGSYILRELRSTDRPHVLVESTRDDLERDAAGSDTPFIEGDATDSDTLLKAGVTRARGLFAVTGDDNQNLVISLTAKGLNPDLRIIASCKAMKNADKIRKAGADAIVSPTYIGGLRMASEMIRPSVVSFLDVMLREEGGNLRIEELPVPAEFVGRPLSELKLQEFEHILLLALRSGEKWHYNPPRRQVLGEGDILIFMTPPEERRNLEEILSGRS